MLILQDYRSTGKTNGNAEKHNISARRTWRKLHIAIDENYQVLAGELTTPEVGDTTAVSDLLAQIETTFETFIGDGAYDGEPVSQAVLEKEPKAKVLIPPPKTAVLSTSGDTQRDQHIQTIEPIRSYGMAEGNRLQSSQSCIT